MFVFYWIVYFFGFRPRSPEDLFTTQLFEEFGQFFERVKNGAPLVQEVYKLIRARLPAAIVAMPGTGKTEAVIEAARRAKDDGIIGGWVHIEGSRDWNADQLSSETMRVDSSSEKLVSTRQPLLIQKEQEILQELRERGIHLTLDEVFPRFQDTKLPDVRRLWSTHKQVWILVIIDEFTRMSVNQIDRLLHIIQNTKASLCGEDRWVCVQFIFAGNAPGMDQGTSTYGHHFWSRIAKFISLHDVPIHVSAEEWSPAFLAIVADENGVPERSRPTRDHHWLASAVRYLLWGTFTLERKGVHQLPECARNLLRTVPQLDPVLGKMMRELSDLTIFGPDSRRVGRWLAAAMLRAQEENAVFDDRHMLWEARSCLSAGACLSFVPGQRPDLQDQYERLVVGVAARVLSNPVVRNYILSLAQPFYTAERVEASKASTGGAVDLAAEVRLALAASRALPFADTVARCIHRFPQFNVADVCAVLSRAFEPTESGAAIAAVGAELIARGFRSGTAGPILEARVLFLQLFRSVRRIANVPYFARLDRIIRELEEWV